MNTDTFTAENWGYPPYNRQSFQYVQALFPTTRLRRGSGPVTEFKVGLKDLNAVSYIGGEGQQRTLGDMLDETYTDAFLVLKDGVILTEDYRNGMGADSHHLLNSVTKTFVGMLIGLLIDDGLLDADEKVAAYIPEFAGTAFAATSLQQALDMTAAVRFGEDYADPLADFWVETAVVGWRPALVNEQSASSLFEYALSLQEVEQVDGEHMHYRTVLTNILGMVAQRVTGVPIQTLLETRIWQKLGPEQDAAIVVDRTGFPYVGAGMNACARDLARFGQMLLHEGFYNQQQIVPAHWIRETLTGNDKLRRQFAESEYAGMLPGGHYHNQTWADQPRGVLLCIGIYGQSIYVDQTTGVVIVKLSTHPEPVDNPLFEDAFLAMAALSNSV